MFKIRWQQHVPNNTVLEMAEAGKISDEVKRRRWNWINHMLRRDPRDDCVVALGWTPEGGRKRGRPKKSLKQPGGGWWNWKGELQAGVHGTQHAV